jgi:RHS repeat-associated protein
MEYDSETGLYHTQFRYYNPRLGSWMTPDPAGLAVSDVADPQSPNRYSYVGNDPVNLADPLGLWSINWVCNLNTTRISFDGGKTWDILFESLSDCMFHFMPDLDDGGDAGGGQTVDSGGKSFCDRIPKTGATYPVTSRQGKSLVQTNLQFNGQGALIGIGIQLNEDTPVTTSNMTIPPWTFVGVTLNSENTVSFGFSNPVRFDLGLAGLKQADFTSATFSNGKYTSARGAWAPWGVTIGRGRGESTLLRNALNQNQQAIDMGNQLLRVANLLSQNITCWSLFGGANQ